MKINSNLKLRDVDYIGLIIYRTSDCNIYISGYQFTIKLYHINRAPYMNMLIHLTSIYGRQILVPEQIRGLWWQQIRTMLFMIFTHWACSVLSGGLQWRVSVRWELVWKFGGHSQ